MGIPHLSKCNIPKTPREFQKLLKFLRSQPLYRGLISRVVVFFVFLTYAFTVFVCFFIKRGIAPYQPLIRAGACAFFWPPETCSEGVQRELGATTHEVIATSTCFHVRPAQWPWDPESVNRVPLGGSFQWKLAGGAWKTTLFWEAFCPVPLLDSGQLGVSTGASSLHQTCGHATSDGCRCFSSI